MPLAPGGAIAYADELTSVRVPMMIVVGELVQMEAREEVLRMIPTSSDVIIIPGASHAAYLHNPPLWHQLLFNFMESVNC